MHGRRRFCFVLYCTIQLCVCTATAAVCRANSFFFLCVCASTPRCDKTMNRHTLFNGGPSEVLKGWFWSVVRSLAKEEKSLLLQFATGCSRLPAGGFSGLARTFTVGGKREFLTADGYYIVCPVFCPIVFYRLCCRLDIRYSSSIHRTFLVGKDSTTTACPPPPPMALSFERGYVHVPWFRGLAWDDV